MKKISKILCLVLVLAMTAGLCCFGTSATYADADEIQYKEAVDVLTALGVLTGDENGFRPADGLKRAEACKIIAYLCDVGDIVGTSAFSDCSGHWAESYIAYCASEGYVDGIGNNKFNPDGTLTGYAFGKMLLGVLGYKSAFEGMTGSDWEIVVAKLIKTNSLSKGISDFDGTQAITREEAAQMALNALQATMVEYEGGTSISVNGVKIESGYVRSSMEDSGSYSYAISGDADDDTNTIQLGEYLYDGKLVKNANDVSENNHPCTSWKYKGITIGEYEKSSAFIYTRDMGSTADSKSVKADLKNYTLPDGYDYEDVVDLTYNGGTIELYADDYTITDVVETYNELAYVRKVTGTAVTLRLLDTDGSSDDYEIDEDNDLWADVEDLSKGDVIVARWVLSYADSTDWELTAIYEPETVIGKVTKQASVTIDSEPYKTYTIGGEVYTAGWQAMQPECYLNLYNDSLLGYTYKLYLDENGYVLGGEEVDSSDDLVYAFVLSTDYAASRGDVTLGAQLLFADGTKAWVDVDEFDGDEPEDIDSDDFTDIEGSFVSYVENDGVYSISTESANDSEKSDVSLKISKKETTLFGETGDGTYSATNATVFIVKNGTGYDVYTGIKNVPTMTIPDGEYVYILYDGTSSRTAAVVYVAKSSVSGADKVFFYDLAPVSYETVSSVCVYEYNAIVNGEDTTILVEEGEAPSRIGLYVDNSYSTKGYVTDLGTPAPTVTNAVNVTMKNGIITLLNSGNTAIKTLVAADELNVWGINTYDSSADELSLDTEDTAGDLGVSAFSAVYYEVDDDGYVTDLFVTYYDN